MKPHPLDPISLIAGLTFLLVAAGFALSNTADPHQRWLFVITAALIVIGGGVLAVLANRSGPTDDAVIADEADLR